MKMITYLKDTNKVVMRPALERKYGGSSPRAVPMPHKIASTCTCGNMLLSGTLEPSDDVNTGGPNSEQSLSSHDGTLFSWIVSYGALLMSILPHCIAFIVNSAICGPK